MKKAGDAPRLVSENDPNSVYNSLRSRGIMAFFYTFNRLELPAIRDAPLIIKFERSPEQYSAIWPIYVFTMIFRGFPVGAEYIIKLFW